MGDRRLGETWTPFQRIKNDVLFGVASAALSLTKRMSDEHRRAAGRALGRWASITMRRMRRRAEARLRDAFGEKPPVTAEQVFMTLGQDLADTVALLDRRCVGDRMPLAPEGRAVLDEALGQGRGVIFCTAHLGPIDLMAASVAECGYEVTTLARESYDPRFTELYDALRGQRGVRTIYRGRAGMEQAIVRALRRGGLVGFPMDLGGRGVAVRQLPFLGRRVGLPIGPARLAALVGAPVVVGTPAPGPSGVWTTVEHIGAAMGDDPDHDACKLTESIAASLERRIRALPEHWVWMHDP